MDQRDGERVCPSCVLLNTTEQTNQSILPFHTQAVDGGLKKDKPFLLRSLQKKKNTYKKEIVAGPSIHRLN